MSSSARFGSFTLDLARGALTRDGVEVPLQPAAFHLLSYLLRHPGRLLSRDDLQQELWPDVFVGDEALSQMIRRIRRALGEDASAPRWLETVPKRGYRFVAEVTWSEQPAVPAPTAGATPGTAAAPTHARAFPLELDPFYGRLDALSTLDRYLLEGARLITVLAAGGMGKTRLAVHFAASRPALERVLFVDLSEVRDLDGVALVMSSSLDVPVIDDPHRNLDRIGRAMAAGGRRLVILDNFETICHLAAETVGRWLGLAPEVRFLVTSRERLELTGEVVLPLGPLDPLSARALFRSRAAAVGAMLAGDEAEAGSIDVLVQRLDGSPLAIELAAGRAAIMSVAQLEANLSARFQMLQNRRRDAPERHRSLQTVIEASVERLTPDQRTMLARCAVLPGPFALETAAALVPDTAAACWLPDLLQDLVDRSMLHPRPLSGGEPLFVMQESIRAFFLERGGAPPVAMRSGLRAALFQRLQVLLAGSRPSLELPTLIEAARQDLDADPAWNSRLALLVAPWLRERGPWSTGRFLIDRALEPGDGLPPAQRVSLLLARASFEPPGTGRAEAMVDEAAALANRHGLEDLRLEAVLTGLDRWISQGRYREALDGLPDSGVWTGRPPHLAALAGLIRLSALQGLGRIDAALLEGVCAASPCEPAPSPASDRDFDPALEMRARLADLQGHLLSEHGRFADALDRYRYAFELYRRLGWRRRQAVILANMASPLSFGGREAEAAGALEEALAIFEEIGDAPGLAAVLTNRSLVALLARRLDDARRDILRARELAAFTGQLVVQVVLHLNLCSLHWLEGDLPAALQQCEQGLTLAGAHDMLERERQLLLWRAGIRSGLGELEGAGRDLERARELLGDDVTSRTRESLEAITLHLEAARARARGDEPRLTEIRAAARSLAERVGPQASLLLSLMKAG